MGEKAENVLKEYSNYNKNNKDQPLANMILRTTVRDYQITKRVVFSVFGIGNPRWERVMSNQLVMVKEDYNFINPKAVTDHELEAFKDF